MVSVEVAGTVDTMLPRLTGDVKSNPGMLRVCAMSAHMNNGANVSTP